MKRQVPCSGYKSEFDLYWRDQNSVVERNARQRKKSPNKADLEHRLPQHMIRSSIESSLALPKPLPQDLEGYALSFFFPSYIFTQRDLGDQQGFLTFLYPVYVASPPSSPLLPTVTAVALCLLEAWSFLRPGKPHSASRKHYTLGVNALRKRLAGNEPIGDDVLLATLMLDMYENICSFSNAQPYSTLHTHGTIAMMGNSKRLRLTNALSQKVLLNARNQIVGKAFRSSAALASSFGSWKEMAPDIPDIATLPGFMLDELNIKVANLQAKAEVLRLDDRTSIPTPIILELQRRAFALDQELLEWSFNLPPGWAPRRIMLPAIPASVRAAGVYREHCNIHKSIFSANMWNFFSTSRIKLQLIVLSCLQNLHDENLEEYAALSKLIIQDQAEDICDNLPFFLGDRLEAHRFDNHVATYPWIEGEEVPVKHIQAAAAYAGWHLMAKLQELLSPRVPVSPETKAWIKGQVLRIKRIYYLGSS